MSDYLIHYGVKGMKWGVRRYQNYDGTLIKKRDFDTTYREIAVDNKDRNIIYGDVNRSGVSKANERKAQRAARNEEADYLKTHPNATEKEALSVRGNKYQSELDKYRNKISRSDQKKFAKKSCII